MGIYYTGGDIWWGYINTGGDIIIIILLVRTMVGIINTVGDIIILYYTCTGGDIIL